MKTYSEFHKVVFDYKENILTKKRKQYEYKSVTKANFGAKISGYQKISSPILIHSMTKATVFWFLPVL